MFLLFYLSVLNKGIESAKAKLQESLKSLIDSGKVIDKTVRDIMKEIANDSKAKYDELKELMQKLIDVATGKGNSTGNYTSIYHCNYLKFFVHIASVLV